MSLLGIDIGSTGCKSTIMSHDGAVLGKSYRAYNECHKEKGIFELAPDMVWELVLATMQEAIIQASVSSLEGISVSSIGEAAVPLDSEGRVLADSILYMDPRGIDECEAFAASLGKAMIVDRTGLVPNGHYTLSKLLWIKENDTKTYEEMKLFLSFAGFVLYRLGGEPVIDYTLASRTMAFNLDTMTMDREICQKAGIDSSVFGNVAASGTVIGTMSRSIMDILNLQGEIPLVSGAHDQICNALGAGIHKGMALEGIGTVDCITPVFDDEGRTETLWQSNFCKVPYPAGGYATYAYSLAGGNINDWFKNQFCEKEQADAFERDVSVYELMNENFPEAPTSLMVLPHLCGSGTPFFDEAIRGAFIGIGLETTKYEMYKGLLEGQCLEMRFNLERLEASDVKPTVIRAVGGGARSRQWLQLKADITGITYETVNVSEAGTIGAVMIAGVAVGIYDSYESAAQQLVHVTDTIYPNQEKKAYYDGRYPLYKALYESVKALRDI